MESLYGLKKDFMELQFMLEDGSIDEEIIEKAMERVGKDLDKKFESYVIVSKNIESTEEAIQKEIDRLNARKNSMKKRREGMLARLQSAMEDTGKDKMNGTLFSLALRRRPESVIITDESAIPKEYIKTKTTTSVDKVSLKKALKNEDIKGAKLESLGYTLKIT